MNQHVAPIERIDPETGEITEVSLTTIPAADQVEAPAAKNAAAEAVPIVEKRKFPVTPVMTAPPPALPTPDANRIDENWGIARFATRGAMHLERYFVMSEKLLWPSILIAMLALILIFSATPSGNSLFVGARGGSGPTAAFLIALPFLVVGAVLGAIVFDAAGYKANEVALGGGAVFFGLPLAFLWFAATSNPNSTAGWVLFTLKVIVIVGAILWISHHLLKIRKSGESRMVIWMAGTYVGVIVIASVILTGVGTALSGFGPGGMRTIAAMLTYDRDSYFDLGGGLRSGPEYRWMSNHAPKGGLSVAKLNSLIGSVRADSAKHSNDAASWEEITKLDTQPMITRPEKAIRDNAKELPNGIVVVPEGREPLTIVAHVEGQWSISLVNGRSCAVFLGPFDPASGCQNETTPAKPLNAYVRQILEQIKPIPTAETKE